MKSPNLLVFAALLVACADDASETDGGGSTSAGSGDTTVSMTMTVGNTGSMETSGGAVDSTGGAAESSTGEASADSTGADPTGAAESTGADPSTGGQESTGAADTEGSTGEAESTGDSGSQQMDTTSAGSDDGEMTSSTGEPAATDTGEPGATSSGGVAETGVTFTTGGCPDVADGVWADCGEGESCDSDASDCVTVSADPTEASCTFECEDICDCPPAPAGSGSAVSCEDIAGPGGMLDGIAECYLDCEGGGPCPAGQDCVADVLCAYIDPAVGVPTHGDCVNVPDALCDDGVCVVDDPGDPGAGVCMEQCDFVEDCPDGPPGGAVACDEILADGNSYCYLDCADNPCPVGMICLADIACLWPVE